MPHKRCSLPSQNPSQEHLLAGAIAFQEVSEELQSVSRDEAHQRRPPLAEYQQDGGGEKTCGDTRHVQPEIRRLSVPPSPIGDRITHYASTPRRFEQDYNTDLTPKKNS